jgi:hypothetical protein
MAPTPEQSMLLAGTGQIGNRADKLLLDTECHFVLRSAPFFVRCADALAAVAPWQRQHASQPNADAGPLGLVLLQLARAQGGDGVHARRSYAAMPKMVWMNCRCATGSPLATQRT